MKTLQIALLLPFLTLFPLSKAAATEAEQVNAAVIGAESILSDAVAGYTAAWEKFEDLYYKQQDYYDFYNSQEKYAHLEFLLTHNDTVLLYLEQDNLQKLGESMMELECIYYAMQDAYWYLDWGKLLSLYDELIIEYAEFNKRLDSCETTVDHIETMMTYYEKRISQVK